MSDSRRLETTIRTRNTTSTDAIRWGGLITLIGAILVGASSLMGMVSASGDTLSEFAATDMFQVAVATGLIGALLLVPGVIAIAMRMWNRSSGWAITGVVGGVTAAASLAAAMYVTTFITTSLAVEAPGVLDLIEEGTLAGPALLGATINAVVQGVGLGVLGIAALRTGAYSRWPAILLVIGAITLPILPVGGMLVVIALSWMGISTFRASEAALPAVTDNTRELVGSSV